MAIEQVDIKLLWGRAGNRCSMCKETVLSAVGSAGGKTIGKQAHIVGNNEGSARCESILTDKERDKYANLILLCGTCHDTIDHLEPENYPIEKLHEIKTTHELWVEQTLSVADKWTHAQEVVYAQCADVASEYLFFDHWYDWTFRLLSGNPGIHHKVFEGLVAFTAFQIRVPYPGKHPEIERAMEILALNVEAVKKVFASNCETNGDALQGVKRYHRIQEVQRLLAHYRDWCLAVTSSVMHMTKSANYFADQIRAFINPHYFLLDGKFMIEMGTSLIDLQFGVPEFTAEEFDSEFKSARLRLDQLTRRIKAEEPLVDLWPYQYTRAE